MKVYKIKVNGKTYRVELESIEEVASSSAPSAAPKAASAPSAAPAAAAAPSAAPTSGEGHEITSPIQGSVVKVLVKVGDQVKKGTALVIIEAMKLENEVVSPFDGVVSAIRVEKGQAVASKEVIAYVK